VNLQKKNLGKLHSPQRATFWATTATLEASPVCEALQYALKFLMILTAGKINRIQQRLFVFRSKMPNTSRL